MLNVASTNLVFADARRRWAAWRAFGPPRGGALHGTHGDGRQLLTLNTAVA
jgi:hypothetical protein